MNCRLNILIPLLAIVGLASCGAEEPVDDGSSPAPKPEVVMADVALSGAVTDGRGNPLSGVKVSTGTLSATTGSDGRYSFAQAGTVSRRAVVRFAKSGYHSLIRSGVQADEMTLDAVLREKGGEGSLQTSFEASDGETLLVGSMEAVIPASAVVKADGSAYTGNVNADMLYLDPNDGDFAETMPGGDLAGVRTDQSEAQLVSYGMTEISLTDDEGNPLQLQKGKSSVLTFPIPEGMENNPPATIPLWAFDEDRGIWVEEGVAKLEGGVYVGEVRHFSWHNLDYPSQRVTIQGKVTDCNGQAQPQVKVTVEESLNGLNAVSRYTDSRGEYSVFVPAGMGVTVTVRSADYSEYKPEVRYDVAGQPGGAVVAQDVELPCMGYVVGQLANTCGDIVAAKVWLEYSEGGERKSTERLIVSGDGTFRLRIPSVTGQATLYAESMTGVRVSQPLSLNGAEQSVRLELCMELAGVVVSGTDGQGKAFSLAIPNEDFEISITSTESEFPRHDVNIRYEGSGSYLCGFRWYGYEPGVTQYVSEPEGMWAYSGAWINEGQEMYGGEYMIDAYGVKFEVLSRDGFTFKVAIEGDGEYWIPGGGLSGGFNVHIEGVITARLATYNYTRLDVATWSAFTAFAAAEMRDWRKYDEDYDTGELIERDPPTFDVEAVPALPVPIDAVLTSAGNDETELFAFGYEKGTKAMFDDIANRFTAAGYTVDVRESQVGIGTRVLHEATATKGSVRCKVYFDPVPEDGLDITPYDMASHHGNPTKYPLVMELKRADSY